MVSDVVDPIRRGAPARIGSIALERVIRHSWFIEDSDDAFGNVIDVCKIALHLSKIEDLNRFSFYDRFREYEQGHVGASARTVHRKESQAAAWALIHMRVAMGQ